MLKTTETSFLCRILGSPLGMRSSGIQEGLRVVAPLQEEPPNHYEVVRRLWRRPRRA